MAWPEWLRDRDAGSMSAEEPVPVDALGRDEIIARHKNYSPAEDDNGRELMSLLVAYSAAVPRPRISRCPITGAVFARSLDTGGLDGLWWDYETPVRPNDDLPPSLYAFTGAVNLDPVVEDTDFLVKPGPGKPFVVPAMLERSEVVAVVSQIAIGRHTGYPVCYFADPRPPGSRFNDWGAGKYWFSDDDGTVWWDRVVEDSTPVDYDLQSWIERGKLQWIAPGDASFTLMSVVRDCPYLGLPGPEGFQRLQHGWVYAAEPPARGAGPPDVPSTAPSPGGAEIPAARTAAAFPSTSASPPQPAAPEDEVTVSRDERSGGGVMSWLRGRRKQRRG